jgi:hypothetical protein
MMYVTVRCYEELNEYLTREKQKRTFCLVLDKGSIVTNVLQSLGIPNQEVDLVLVNQRPVDFSWEITHGDRITFYPVFETFDISPINCLRSRPLRRTRFLVGNNLSSLGIRLRAVGMIAREAANMHAEEIQKKVNKQCWTLLTTKHQSREIGKLNRVLVLNSSTSAGQFDEVINRLNLCLFKKKEYFEKTEG